jgi:dTMP kinase
LFVSLEGIDGSGKTTQAKLLAKDLGEETALVREPGGTELGERLRDLILKSSEPLSPMVELQLFCVARSQLVDQVIRPALDEGRTVVSDRFSDSSVAYQGGGRGLDPADVRNLCDIVTEGLWPDLTIYLKIDPDKAFSKLADSDRIESEGVDFQRKVAEAYDRIAVAEADRVRIVDAGGSVKVVHKRVMEEVGRLAHR